MPEEEGGEGRRDARQLGGRLAGLQSENTALGIGYHPDCSGWAGGHLETRETVSNKESLQAQSLGETRRRGLRSGVKMESLWIWEEWRSYYCETHPQAGGSFKTPAQAGPGILTFRATCLSSLTSTCSSPSEKRLK